MGSSNSREEEEKKEAERRRLDAERVRAANLNREREENSRLHKELSYKQLLANRLKEQLQAEQLKTQQIRAAELKAQLQAEQLKAQHVQTTQWQAEQLNTQQIQTAQLKAQLQAEQLRVQQIQAEQIRAQQIQNERKLCPNSRFGCTISVPDRELLSHCKSCLCRPYHCPMKHCSWQGIYSKLFCHAEEVHAPFTGMQFGQYRRVLLGPDESLLHHQELVFKLYARPTQPRLAMCWALQLLGPPADAADWKYEIQINRMGDHVKRVQISDMCLHEDEDVEEVLNEGACPSVPAKVLGNYLQKNRISFKLKIYNKRKSEQPKVPGDVA